jgi:hypothetical protein
MIKWLPHTTDTRPGDPQWMIWNLDHGTQDLEICETKTMAEG